MGNRTKEQDEVYRSPFADMRDFAWKLAGVLAAILVIAIAVRELVAG